MVRALEAALAVRLEELASRDLSPVEVAILDSGIDATHPDLVGRVVAAYTIETVDGKPVAVEHEPNINADVYGHGTGVASVVARVAPNARIVDIRVLGQNNKGSGDVMVAGLQKAIERGSRVINMSLAAKALFAQPLAALAETAYRQNQVIVAAKRNFPIRDNGYPAELSACISVDGEKFESPLKLLYRSDDPIEYVAAGEDITVAAPGGGYTTKTGTSFAAPAVSGMCALLTGAFGELRPFEVKALLKANSER